MPGRLPASDYENYSPDRLRHKPMRCSGRVKERAERPTQPSALHLRMTQAHRKVEGTQLLPTLPTLSRNSGRGLPPFEMNPSLQAIPDPCRPVMPAHAD